MAKKPRERGKRSHAEAAAEAVERAGEKTPESAATTSAPAAAAAPDGRIVLAAVLAFLVPGAGHLFLKRPVRGVLLAVVVFAMLAIGWALDGQLPATFSGSPLLVLQSLGAAGSGVAYWLLLRGLGYAGDPLGPGYEYGGAFLITAGVLNLLLVLDAWDLGSGLKE